MAPSLPPVPPFDPLCQHTLHSRCNSDQMNGPCPRVSAQLEKLRGPEGSGPSRGKACASSSATAVPIFCLQWSALLPESAAQQHKPSSGAASTPRVAAEASASSAHLVFNLSPKRTCPTYC